MPKKGNLATHNTSYLTPRLPPIRPKIFKENRLELIRILTSLHKGKIKKFLLSKRALWYMHGCSICCTDILFTLILTITIL